MTTLDVHLTDRAVPLVDLAGSDAPTWLAQRRDLIDALVDEHGAVLLRGALALHGSATANETAAAAAVAALVRELAVEHEPFASRQPVAPGLASSAQWPPDQPMCMHHELSYLTRPPSRQLFACLKAAEEGGAICLADGAAVLDELPAGFVAGFAEHGWALNRRHGGSVGLDWPDAFGTNSRVEVERYCKEHDIEFAWDHEGGLCTHRVRPAVVRHPRTGHFVWFNQVAFLNAWTMDPAVREYLLFECGPEGLPFDTCRGDGLLLDAATVEMINEVYSAHTVRVPLRDGDLLVVDNLRMAHSREPYRGERRIAVALADPVGVS